MQLEAVEDFLTLPENASYDEAKWGYEATCLLHDKCTLSRRISLAKYLWQRQHLCQSKYDKPVLGSINAKHPRSSVNCSQFGGQQQESSSQPLFRPIPRAILPQKNCKQEGTRRSARPSAAGCT